MNSSGLRFLFLGLIVPLSMLGVISLDAAVTRFEFLEEPNNGEQKILDENQNPGPTILGQFKYTVVTSPAAIAFMNQFDLQPAGSVPTVTIPNPDDGANTPEISLFEGITFLYPFAKEPAASGNTWVLGPLTINGETPLSFFTDQGPPRAPEIGGLLVEGGRTQNFPGSDPNLRAFHVNLAPLNQDVSLEIVFNRFDVDTTTSLEVSFIGTVTNNTSLFDSDPNNEPNPNPFPGAIDRREALADVVAQLGRILSGVPDTGPPLSVELVDDITTRTGPFPLIVNAIDKENDPSPNIAPAKNGPGLGLFNAIGFDFRTISADGDYEIIVGARDVFDNASPGAFSAFGNLDNPVAGVPTRILVRKDTIAPQDILLDRPRSVFIFGNVPPSVDPPFEDSIFLLKGSVPDERGESVKLHILSQDSPDEDSNVGSANNQLQDSIILTNPDGGLVNFTVDATPWAPQFPAKDQVAYRWGFAPEDFSGNLNADNDVELLMIKDTFAPSTPSFTNLVSGTPIKTSIFRIQAEAPNQLDENAEHGRMTFEFSISLITATSGILPLQSIAIPASTSDLVPITDSKLDDAFLAFSHEITILDPLAQPTGQIVTVDFPDRTNAFDNLVYEKFFMDKAINFTKIPDGVLLLDLCLLDQVGNKSNPCTSVVVIKDTSGPNIEFELGESGPDDNYTASFPDQPNFFGADDQEFRVSLKSPEFTVDDGPGNLFPEASVPDPSFLIAGIPIPQGIGLLIKGKSIENFGFTSRIDVSGSTIPSFSVFDNVNVPSGFDLKVDFGGSPITINQPSFNLQNGAVDFEIRVPMLDFREGVQEVVRLEAVDNLGNKGPQATIRVLRDVIPADPPQITVPPIPTGFTLPLIYTNKDSMTVAGVAEANSRLVILLPPPGSSAGFLIDSTNRIPLTSPGSIPIPGSDFDSFVDSCASLTCFFVDADELGNFQLKDFDISTIESSLSTPTTIYVQAIDTFDNTDPDRSIAAIEVHRNNLQVPIDHLYLLDYPIPGSPNRVEILPDSAGQSPGSTVFYSSNSVRFKLETLFPMLKAPDLEFRQSGEVFRGAGKIESSFPLEIGTFSFQYVFEVSAKVKDFDGDVEFKISGGRDLFGNPVVSTTGPLAFVVDTVAPNEFSTPPIFILSPVDSLLVTTYVSSRVNLEDRFKDTSSTVKASGIATNSLSMQLFGPLQFTPDSLNEIGLTTFIPPEFDFEVGSTINAPLLTDGTYRLSVLAVDQAGNKARFNRTFVYDRQPIVQPLISSKPAAGSFISTFPNTQALGSHVEVVIGDIEVDLDRSDFRIFSPSGQLLSTTKTISLTKQSILHSFLPTSVPAVDGSSDGEYRLNIEVYDQTGNQTLKTISFIYDTTKPFSNIQFPSLGSCVRDLQLVQLHVDDSTSVTTQVAGLDFEKSEVLLNLIEARHPENQNRDNTKVGSAVLYASQDGDSARTEVFAKLIGEEGQALPKGGSFDGLYQLEGRIRDRASNEAVVVTTFLFDSVSPEIHLSGLGDLDFLTNQFFTIRGTIADRGPCGLASAGPGFFQTSQLELNILEWSQDEGKEGTSLAGPFFPESISAANAISFPLESSQGSFEITGIFPGGTGSPSDIGYALLKFNVFDRVGNHREISRVVRLFDTLPPFPRRLSPLGTTNFRGVQLQTYTTNPVLNLSWEPVVQAEKYRLHLSRESITPGVRTTFIDVSSTFTSAAIDYTFVTTTSMGSALAAEETLFWLVESLDGIGQGSDPVGAFGRGEKIIFDRQAEIAHSSQVSLVVGTEALPLDSARAFATGTSVSFVWSAPEPLRLTGKEVAWVEYLRDGTQQFFDGIDSLPVETSQLIFHFPFPDKQLNGLANLHLELFKDRAGNRLNAISTSFKIDRGPEFDVKIFENPVDPLSFGFVFRALDYDGRMDALKLDPNRPTPKIYFSQASQAEKLLSFEVLRKIGIAGEDFGTAFAGAFHVDMELVGDVVLRLEGEDFRGFESESMVFLHVRSDRPLRSIGKVPENRVAVSGASNYLVGSRGQAGMRTTSQVNQHRRLIQISDFPHLYYPRQKEMSVSGSIFTSYDCAHLRFVRIDQGGHIFDVNQRNQCISGSLKYSLISSSINELELIYDGNGPSVELIEPLKDDFDSDLIAGRTRFLARSQDGETLVSHVVLVHNENRLRLESLGDGLYAADYILEEGVQNIDLQARDILGNQSKISLNLHVIGSFGFQACDVYPNPIRTTGTLDCRFNQQPEKLRVSLYDTAGSRIRNFNFEPARRISEFFDLENDMGTPLRNGVYFLKIQAYKGSERIHKILKVAITR